MGTGKSGELELVQDRVRPFPTVPGAVAGNGAETRHRQLTAPGI